MLLDFEETVPLSVFPSRVLASDDSERESGLNRSSNGSLWTFRRLRQGLLWFIGLDTDPVWVIWTVISISSQNPDSDQQSSILEPFSSLRCLMNLFSWISNKPEDVVDMSLVYFFTTCSSTCILCHWWWNKSNPIDFQTLRCKKTNSFTPSLILYCVCISCLTFASVLLCFSSQRTVRATVCLWTTAGWAAAAPTRTSFPATPRGPWTCRTPGTSSSSTTRTRTTAAGTDDTTCPTSSSPVGISWSHHGLCINKTNRCVSR